MLVRWDVQRGGRLSAKGDTDVAAAGSGYEYKAILADALKVRWEVEDLIGGGRSLDFSRPFLPEVLAGVSSISCLDAAERLKLNQIRGHSYLGLFGLVEEFILAFVMEQALRALRGKDPYETRVLTSFVDEEAKHRHLFERFAQEFDKGFGSRCEVVGPASDISAVVLRHAPLGVALLILHLEWMTQRHFLEAVRAGEPVEPRFLDLLRRHWQEEAQHAKADTLIVEQLARKLGPERTEEGVDAYLALVAAFDGLLARQVELDLGSLARATGRTLSPAEAEALRAAQRQAYRWTFLGTGMVHPNFIRTLGDVSPRGQERVAEAARPFR
jgi:hypothetical protein